MIHARECVYDLLFEIANDYEVQKISCVVNGDVMSLKEVCRWSIVAEIKLILEEILNVDSTVRSKAHKLICSLDKFGNDRSI